MKNKYFSFENTSIRTYASREYVTPHSRVLEKGTLAEI
jgi:hypothetical protein